MTIVVTFDPFPLQPANTMTYRVTLSNAQGLPVTDAIVVFDIAIGDLTIECVDDEMFTVALRHEGNGIYSTRTSVGGMRQDFVIASLCIRRGGESWDLILSRKDVGWR